VEEIPGLTVDFAMSRGATFSLRVSAGDGFEPSSTWPLMNKKMGPRSSRCILRPLEYAMSARAGSRMTVGP